MKSIDTLNKQQQALLFSLNIDPLKVLEKNYYYLHFEWDNKRELNRIAVALEKLEIENQLCSTITGLYGHKQFENIYKLRLHSSHLLYISRGQSESMKKEVAYNLSLSVNSYIL